MYVAYLYIYQVYIDKRYDTPTTLDLANLGVATSNLANVELADTESY